MDRAKPITREQTEQVIKLRGIMTANQIAEKVGVTYNQVHEVFKRNNMTDKQNPIFQINDIQNQIYLAGKLGDGNYKPNGKYNYYYRENHAEDEKEYLIWKMNTLGDMISKGGLYKIKMSKSNVQQAYGFSTKTSPSLIPYAKMTLSETILKLNQYGLVMYMLDDGWFKKYKHKNGSISGGFGIAGGVLTKDDLNLLCEQFSKYNIEDVHIIGKQKLEVSIPPKNNKKLFDIAKQIIPIKTDIMQKKFKYVA